jgi:NTP pyrophosphatase (non-canonical NTP hydrolase)
MTSINLQWPALKLPPINLYNMPITKRDAENINSLVIEIHYDNVAAGWWKDNNGVDIRSNPYCFSNKLALVHSELSEALEADRKSLPDDKLTHRPGREVELADAVIRIFDLAGAYGMDLGGALVEKAEYNKRRLDHKLENRNAPGGKAY